MPTTILFIGPAASGKSSLVASYSLWLRNNGYEVFTVNLDPAAEYIPYRPDLDIRDYVTAKDIAIKKGLGPNGALVEALNIISHNVESYLSMLRKVHHDYILVDTPGQMESFIFHEASVRITSWLKSVSKYVYGIFVVDASIIKRPTDYVFTTLMSIAVTLRLGIDIAPVLNKIDLVPNLSLKGDLISDIDKLMLNESQDESLYVDLTRELSDVLIKYCKAAEVPKVSATKGIGMEDLHRLIHELSCTCGDLT